MKKNHGLILIFCLSASLASEAKYSVINGAKLKESNRTCPLKNSDDTHRRQELSKGWESLPTAVLVAKEVHMVVDGPGLHYESLQNFLIPGTKALVCGHSKQNSVQRFSILVPTLIDTTISAKVGSSVWNFQLLLDQKNIKSWNLPSKGSNQSFELAKIFKDQGVQEKYYRRDSDEYEIVATKEVEGKTITLSVVFDSIEDL